MGARSSSRSTRDIGVGLSWEQADGDNIGRVGKPTARYPLIDAPDRARGQPVNSQ